jgi:hypothetical protein
VLPGSCHPRATTTVFVIDVDDLDRRIAFWSAALDATEEPLSEKSHHIYRRLRLPDAEIRVLLERTDDEKVSKERMHLDLETDDVETEVRRLEALVQLRVSCWHMMAARLRDEEPPHADRPAAGDHR